MKKPSRQYIKSKAQDELMSAMQTAFTRAEQECVGVEVLEEMDRQFTRVERLFGYEIGSWHRGS